MAREYMNVLTTYGCYAKTLWHADPPTGYWGDGITAKNQNGAVRGMCNTMLTYVMLARGLDHNWIAEEDRAKLDACGLTRDELTSYAKAQLDYLIAHHKSTTAPLEPTWGFGWQSSLWLGGAGPAVLLIWNDLSDQQRAGITHIAAAEADRIASLPPKDYVAKGGDTGAEENGWNTAAPALALALAPKDPRAPQWWRALKVYAVNTYSHPRDRTSTATIGTDKVSDLASTANLLADWTMFNHGFFHPDYVQVSGQHLGEAWMILALGDKLHNTKRAEESRPYALHNVREVWDNVCKPILLPSGEFAFPNGNDWTYHCSTIQSYLAFIAAALGDPVAAAAEREGIKHVQRRREVSPPGRLLGDSNLEWWWEPLVCKRASTALLQHELASEVQGAKSEEGKSKPQRHRDTESSTEESAQTWFYPDAKVWVHRNGNYLVSASWGTKRMGAFYPLQDQSTASVYMSFPVENALIPKSITMGKSMQIRHRQAGLGSPKNFPAIYLQGSDGTGSAILALANSAVLITTGSLGGIAIENDTLTSPGRTLYWADGEKFVPALHAKEDLQVPSPWINVDDRLSVLSDGNLQFISTGTWTRKSAAAGLLQPTGSVCQLLPNTSKSMTASPALQFRANVDEGILRVQDGDSGPVYDFDIVLTNANNPVTEFVWRFDEVAVEKNRK